MFTYTLLNLIKSPVRTFQLILAATIVLLLMLTAGAFQEGMKQSLSISGDSKNVILLGVGSEESMERSEVPFSAVSAAKTIPGIEESLGSRAVSPQIIFNSVVTFQGKDFDAILRGITPEELLVYPAISIQEGRFPNSGEILVGKMAYQRLGIPKENLTIGSEINYEGKTFTIVGTFAAPGTTLESEIWFNLNDLMAITQRDSVSAIILRLGDAEFDDIDLFTKQRLDLQLSAVKESDYYQMLDRFYQPIQTMAWITAILIAAGALFGGLNTFYAALMSRKKEFATLQAIGFSRTKILMTIVGESLFVHVLAFLTAAIIALYLFPAIHVGFGSTYFSLSLTPSLILATFLLAFAMSVLVTCIPAWHCLTPPLNNLLKD
ncbi:MAG: FtsX-like permease family protein [Lentisphaeria bacterium]|nr:FtsX-like permease family protein [Lentisphaeria bacterium]